MKAILPLLEKFVNQRPGLDFANYGDVAMYRKESREITNDRKDFYEMLNFGFRRFGSTEAFEKAVENEFKVNNGRLQLVEVNGNLALQYCTGQYFPTEFRPAATRILFSAIWKDYSNETESNSPNQVYKTGDDIRKAMRKWLSRRVSNIYLR